MSVAESAEKPTIRVATDKDGLKFEAFELRSPGGASLFVDVAMVERCGGIEVVRNAISPHLMIVIEKLI